MRYRSFSISYLADTLPFSKKSSSGTSVLIQGVWCGFVHVPLHNIYLSSDTHSIDITAKFAVNIKEKQDRLPTLYWLPKLHKRPYKARFIANSSSCTTTVLSKLLTSCLTAVKKTLN